MNIEDEFFCLKYELETLSNVYFHNKAERWVKGFLHPIYENEHLDRYDFAKNFVKDKIVLDIACGSGYGTYLLATQGMAKKVMGVDLDEDAVKYGNIKYASENVKRVVDDATEFFSHEKYDVIVCFETIEHIPDYKKFVDNLFKNLKEDGTLLISTPITLNTTTTPGNKYHVIEWSFTDFQELFKKQFTIQDIYIQDVVIELKKWEVPSFCKKLLNRIFTKEIEYEKRGLAFEKYTNQYDMSKCISGYQMIKLKK